MGVVGIARRLVTELLPVRGRPRLARLLQFLDAMQVDATTINLKSSMEEFVTNRPRRGLAVLISDLFDPNGFEDAIDCLALHGFQPYLLQVVDDCEVEPDFAGSIQLVDVLGGNSRNVYLEDIDVANYRQVFREFSAACRRYCARRSIGIMQTRTGVPFEQAMLSMIRTATSRMYAR
jgi:hypothetical protein